MFKDILIQCLRTSPIGKDKIIVDVEDIKEINGQGWDFTLKYRPLIDPFGMNEISFHRWVTKEFYGAFEETYTKNEEEFVNDIMMLMASFSGKLYGKRSVKRKKEIKEQKLKEKQNGTEKDG